MSTRITETQAGYVIQQLYRRGKNKYAPGNQLLVMYGDEDTIKEVVEAQIAELRKKLLPESI